MVTHGYPPRQGNGAEIQLHRKNRWWQSRGHTIRVVAADPVSSGAMAAGEMLETPDEIDDIDVLRLTFAAPDHTRPFRETYLHPLLESAVEKQISDFKPDLIYQISGYICGTLPARLGRRNDIPSVLFATDYWHSCPRITLLRPSGEICQGASRPSQCAACRLADRAFVRRFGARASEVAWHLSDAAGGLLWTSGLPDLVRVREMVKREQAIREDLPSYSLVISNSKFLGRQLERLGIPPERILVVRQGISNDEFRDMDGSRDRSGEEVRLLYLGQISRHKGVDLVINAVESLARGGLPVRLTVHGPVTDSDANFQRLIRGKGLRATTVGQSLPRNELVEQLVSHDAVVVPSRWYENSPNVILEAFATRTPVITANHGGMAEMVRDGVDGLLFQPGDILSLRNALRRLCSEPDLLPRLSSGTVRPYGVDKEMWVEERALQNLLSKFAQMV